MAHLFVQTVMQTAIGFALIEEREKRLLALLPELEEEEDCYGDDFRTKAWKPPDRKKARTHRAHMLWHGGKERFWKVGTQDLGRLGAGIQLYFKTLKFLCILFFGCFVLSLPQMVINSNQNGGHALSQTELSPLTGLAEFIVSLSLAGQGMHRDTTALDYTVYGMSVSDDGDKVNEFGVLPCSCASIDGYAAGEQWCLDDGVADCRLSCPRNFTVNGTSTDDELSCHNADGIHCGWSSVSLNVLGLGWEAYDAIGVSYFITTFEFLISVGLVLAASAYRSWVNTVADETDKANATPADYTVFVRGLPKDATAEDLHEHFSSLYDLQRNESLYFPSFGMTAAGGAVVRGLEVALLWAVFISPAIYSALVYSGVDMNPALAGLINFALILAMGLTSCMLCHHFRKAKWLSINPVPRETVQQRFDREVIEVLEERQRFRSARSWSTIVYEWVRGKPVKVAPTPTSTVRFLEFYRQQQAVRGQQNPTRVVPVTGSGGAEGGALLNPYLSEVQAEENLPRRPDPQPVQDVIGDHDDAYVGTWVAQLSLCHPLGPAQAAFSHNNHKRLQKSYKLKDTIRKYGDLTKLNGGPQPKKVEKAEAELEKIEKKLQDVEHKIRAHANYQEEVVGAFVTFEHEESMCRCVEDYRWTNSLLMGAFVTRFQPRILKFKHSKEIDPRTGKPKEYPLQVSTAPDPSNVLWENVELSDWSRVRRTALTTLVTVVLLLITFLLIVVLTELKMKFAGSLPDSNTCLHGIPASFQGHYPDGGGTFGVSFVINQTLSNEQCGDGEYYVSFVHSDTVDRSAWLGDEYAGSNTVVINQSVPFKDPIGNLWPRSKVAMLTDSDVEYDRSTLCDDPCFKPSDKSTCATPTCYASERACYGNKLADEFDDNSRYGDRMCMQEWFYQDTVTNDCKEYKVEHIGYCYCLQEMAFIYDAVPLAQVLSKLRDFVNVKKNSDICYDMILHELLSDMFSGILVGSVVVINVVLKEILEALSQFEGHANVAEQTASLVGKLFAAQLLNTTLLGLLINTAYNGNIALVKVVRSFLGHLGLPVLQGVDSDFTHEWYLTQGYAASVTMLLQVFVPHISPFIKAVIVTPIKRLVKAGSLFGLGAASSQRELNEAFEGGAFAIHTRYAYILNFIFISLFYAGGIPSMYLLASMNFLITYLLDKFLVVRVLNKPPQYDSQLAFLFAKYFPVAVLLHLGATGYMFSNDDILRTNYWTIPRCIAEANTDHEYVALLNHFIMRYLARANVFPITFILALWSVFAVFRGVFGRTFMRALQGLALGLGLSSMVPESQVTARQPGFTEELPDAIKVKSQSKGKRKLKHQRTKLTPTSKAVQLFWTQAGFVDGKPHERGQRKRIWEQISEDQQYDFVMHKNPKYKHVCALLARSGFEGEAARPSSQSSSRALRSKSSGRLTPDKSSNDEDQREQRALDLAAAEEGKVDSPKEGPVP